MYIRSDEKNQGYYYEIFFEPVNQSKLKQQIFEKIILKLHRRI